MEEPGAAPVSSNMAQPIPKKASRASIMDTHQRKPSNSQFNINLKSSGGMDAVSHTLSNASMSIVRLKKSSSVKSGSTALTISAQKWNLLAISRPFTWAATLIAFILPFPDWSSIERVGLLNVVIGFIFFGFPFNLLFFAVNDLSDEEIDQGNSNRPSDKFHRRYLRFGLIIGIAITILFMIFFANATSLTSASLFVNGVALALPLCNGLIVDRTWPGHDLIFYIIWWNLPTCYTHLLLVHSGIPFHHIPLRPSLTYTGIIVCIQMQAACMDIIADKKHNKDTLASAVHARFGLNAVTALTVLFRVVAYFIWLPSYTVALIMAISGVYDIYRFVNGASYPKGFLAEIVGLFISYCISHAF